MEYDNTGCFDQDWSNNGYLDLDINNNNSDCAIDSEQCIPNSISSHDACGISSHDARGRSADESTQTHTLQATSLYTGASLLTDNGCDLESQHDILKFPTLSLDSELDLEWAHSSDANPTSPSDGQSTTNTQGQSLQPNTGFVLEGSLVVIHPDNGAMPPVPLPDTQLITSLVRKTSPLTNHEFQPSCNNCDAYDEDLESQSGDSSFPVSIPTTGMPGDSMATHESPICSDPRALGPSFRVWPSSDSPRVMHLTETSVSQDGHQQDDFVGRDKTAKVENLTPVKVTVIMPEDILRNKPKRILLNKKHSEATQKEKHRHRSQARHKKLSECFATLEGVMKNYLEATRPAGNSLEGPLYEPKRTQTEILEAAIDYIRQLQSSAGH